MNKQKEISICNIIRKAIVNNKKQKILVSELVKSFGNNGFYMFILLLSLIVVIPTPQPIALICGTLIIFFSIQIISGFKEVWFPNFISKKQINKKTLNKILIKVLFIIEKLEKYTKKRLNFMEGSIQNKIIATSILLIGLGCLTPVPFINTFPGISIIFISFGILNKDGLIVIIGYLLSIIGFSVIISTFSLAVAMILKIIK